MSSEAIALCVARAWRSTPQNPVDKILSTADGVMMLFIF